LLHRLEEWVVQTLDDSSHLAVPATTLRAATTGRSDHHYYQEHQGNPGFAKLFAHCFASLC
jgi:hypothetical protein